MPDPLFARRPVTNPARLPIAGQRARLGPLPDRVCREGHEMIPGPEGLHVCNACTLQAWHAILERRSRYVEPV